MLWQAPIKFSKALSWRSDCFVAAWATFDLFETAEIGWYWAAWSRRTACILRHCILKLLGYVCFNHTWDDAPPALATMRSVIEHACLLVDFSILASCLAAGTTSKLSVEVRNLHGSA
jgi:hypothetical protein